MEILYREKAFHAETKIKKNDFAPSEKFSSYAPLIELSDLLYRVVLSWDTRTCLVWGVGNKCHEGLSAFVL